MAGEHGAMSGLQGLNLIHFLDFYFMLFFFLGTLRRIRQYQDIGKLVVTGPGRWPRLLSLVKQHRTLFLTWSTVLPALLALLLSLMQLWASRVVWPEAGQPPEGLTVATLIAHWPALALIAPLGLAMLAVDLYGLIRVGQVDRLEMEKYFDEAEYWLRSKTAHLVRVFTLGRINPRHMVAVEVHKALVAVSLLLNTTLWWVTVQLSLRVAFGLSLWLTWALSR
jgi:hypothetical protein